MLSVYFCTSNGSTTASTCALIGAVTTIHKESAEIVKADFDQIGSLVENKAVPRDEFLKIYWFEVLKIWKVLFKDEIENIRAMDPGYMRKFETLKDWAEQHQKQMEKNKANEAQVEIIKDVIIKPAIKDFKVEIEGQKYKISALFDIL